VRAGRILARVKDLVAADPRSAIFARDPGRYGNSSREMLAANRSLIGLLFHDGWTPLHLTAFFGKTEAARLLLNKAS